MVIGGDSAGGAEGLLALISVSKRPRQIEGVVSYVYQGANEEAPECGFKG
jgi:hypothetical protein